MDPRLHHFARQHPLFASMADRGWEALCAAATLIQLPAGALLYRRGEAADTLYLIVAGQLSLHDSGAADDTIGPITAGEVVAAHAMVAGARHGHDAVTATPLEAWALPASAFRCCLEGNFGRTLDMIAALSARLRERVKDIAEYKLHSTAERLAGYLAAIAGSVDGPTVLSLPCEKRALAERLGMDPATLSRAFAKLRSLGVESDRRDNLIIADVARLRAFAMPDGGLHMGEIG